MNAEETVSGKAAKEHLPLPPEAPLRRSATEKTATVSTLDAPLMHAQEPGRTRTLTTGRWLLAGGFFAWVEGGALFVNGFLSKTNSMPDFIIGVLLMIVGQILRAKGARISRAALADSSQSGDARNIGPILDIRFNSFADTELQVLARRALIPLLPHLKEKTLLSSRQYRRLYSLLKIGDPNTEADFLIALLKAIERVGDSRALPPVSQLALGSAETAREKRVREKARRCLTVLRTRQQQEQTSGVLLRASALGDVTLLHPAQSQTAPGASELLRPENTKQQEPPEER